MVDTEESSISLHQVRTACLAHTVNFVGRGKVFQAIDRWLADPAGPRFFILTGEPGSGKTAVASWLGFFQEELEDQPSNVKSLAGALSFFSVGLALGVAYVVGILIQGTAAWPVSAFLTTIVYVAAVGLELAVSHQICGSDE
jgi:hypothetical protein